MKEDLTEIIVIMDRSGSMASMYEHTISGFNEFLKSQQELPGEAKMTYVQFDNKYEVVHDCVDIKEIPELTGETFQPRGTTSLYDAIGKTFNTIGKRLSETPEEERPGKVIIAIMTDGGENTSQEFKGEEGRKKIEAMIEHQDKKFNWNTMFLASGIEAQDAAISLGGASRVMCLSTSAKGMRGGYRAFGSAVNATRSGSKPMAANDPSYRGILKKNEEDE